MNIIDGRKLAEKIKAILEDNTLKNKMINSGQKQVRKFSWKKCAQETLEYLKSQA